jgi:hypothetical protein
LIGQPVAIPEDHEGKVRVPIDKAEEDFGEGNTLTADAENDKKADDKAELITPPTSAPTKKNLASPPTGRKGLVARIFGVFSHSVASPTVVGLVFLTAVALCGFLFVRWRNRSSQEMIQEDKPLLDAEEFY